MGRVIVRRRFALGAPGSSCSRPKQATNRIKIRQGFSLVELVVVVLILGTIAAIAVPNLLQSSQRSQATAMAQQIRKIDDAVQRSYFENQKWPSVAVPTGKVPPELSTYLPKDAYSGKGLISGPILSIENNIIRYSFGSTQFTANEAQLQLVDSLIDDGNSGSGNFLYTNGSMWLWIAARK